MNSNRALLFATICLIAYCLYGTYKCLKECPTPTDVANLNCIRSKCINISTKDNPSNYICI